MKKIIEIENAGFEALLGEQVLVFCMRYIYTGKLSGVNSDKIVLENPYIVYETGSFDSKTFEDAQKFGPDELFLMTNSIESLGVTDKRA